MRALERQHGWPQTCIIARSANSAAADREVYKACGMAGCIPTSGNIAKPLVDSRDHPLGGLLGFCDADWAGCKETAKLLVEKGADPHGQGRPDGATPLEVLADAGLPGFAAELTEIFMSRAPLEAEGEQAPLSATEVCEDDLLALFETDDASDDDD